MNTVSNSVPSYEDLPTDLSQLAQTVRMAAQSRMDDCLALLEMLRLLDELHDEIRDTLFCDALPDNRQKLYHLLKNIEQQGGWPYIQRMELIELIKHLEEADGDDKMLDNEAH